MKKINVITFHPFERSIIKDIFFKNKLHLDVSLYKEDSVFDPNEINIFIGTCAGNRNSVALGDLVQVGYISYNSELLELSNEYNFCETKSRTKYTENPITQNENLFENDIAEMESYTLYKKLSSSLVMCRVVTDYGFDSNISIKEYKREIEKYYREGIKKFTKKMVDKFELV